MYVGSGVPPRLASWQEFNTAVEAPQSFDIAHGRQAEASTVFTIELIRTFVSHCKGRTCGIKSIQQHLVPGSLQTKLLLILQRAHGG